MRSTKNKKQLTFIDLFAGLGGFHLALDSLDYKCVYACEIDNVLSDIYKKNFNITPDGDIRNVKVEDIPKHNILCAGFPCQPFSKAGWQKGFKDPKNGDLFYYVLKIIQYHKPDYLMLENVANIETHNDGKTWKRIKRLLKKEGYAVDAKKLSPHKYGIPQIRERFFIVGSRKELSHFEWPFEIHNSDLSIKSVLDKNPKNYEKLSPQVLSCLRHWQKFLKLIPKDVDIPSPLWAMEFGATYPYEKTTPYSMKVEELRKYKGSFGKSLKNVKTSEDYANYLPSHAVREQEQFPSWKIRFIKENRDFYKRHKKVLKDWIKEIQNYPQSLQKFEWNCYGEERDIWKYIIQFRASGVRVKRPTTSPALISMTSTQVPIIGWEKRYMTPRECSRLQSMEKLKYLPGNKTRAFAALGGAVNVSLVQYIAIKLIQEDSREKNIHPYFMEQESP